MSVSHQDIDALKGFFNKLTEQEKKQFLGNALNKNNLKEVDRKSVV